MRNDWLKQNRLLLKEWPVTIIHWSHFRLFSIDREKSVSRWWSTVAVLVEGFPIMDRYD